MLAVLMATSAAGCATVPRENLTGFATTTAAIRSSVDQSFAAAAGTPAEVAVLAGQIREINRRVTALGRAALIDVTIEMTSAASSLRDAIPAVINAIDEAESTASATRQVTAALGIVDAALNAVKQVG